MSSQPAWLRAVLQAENSLAGPINRLTNSREGAQLILLAGVSLRAANDVGERGRTLLVHSLSLPSRRDVQALSVEVQRLQRMVEELAANQAGASARKRTSVPTSAPAPKRRR